MRQAIVENGIVTNVIIGDGGGVDIPEDSPVGPGWLHTNGVFAAPPAPLKTAAHVQTEIDAAYDTAINTIADQYPATERDSWPKQESEARAYLADNSAATPLLSAISTARGITVPELATRVVSNADAYTALAGQIIGRRQARMDAIAAAVAANNQAALQAVTW